MGEYRELLMQAKRRFRRLAGGGLATIGTAVAAAGLVIAIGAPEALAEQQQVSKKGQVARIPVARRAPGEGLNFADAFPMPLPQSALRPASLAEAMLKAPALHPAKPWSRPGAAGNGKLRPVVLVPAKQIPDEGPVPSNGMVSQQFGTGGLRLPYTTSQVNALEDDTDLHLPFRAAGKVFFNIGTDTFVCSASLIAPGIVVTAAHCVVDFGTSEYFTNWQYVPAYNNGVAPFGVSTSKAAYVLQSWLDGTDACVQVACENDVAVITLNPLNGDYVGRITGWLGFGVDGYGFTPDALTQITQLGYPVALDGGLLMERTDSVGLVDPNLSNNTIIGSLMTGGSSGGPWVVNLGNPPSLSDTSFGQDADPNRVVGVTSWGLTDDAVKLQGASPFTSGNVQALFNEACGGTPAACQ